MKRLLIAIAITALTVPLFGQLDTINTGLGPNTGTGESARSAFTKTNWAIKFINNNLPTRSEMTGAISTALVPYVIDGDFTSQGIMRRGATAGTYSILTDNSANWNTAYGWGNHASAGYVTGTPWLSAGFAPLNSPTFTGTTVLPVTTTIGNVSSTEIGYIDGLNGTAASRQNINDSLDVYLALAEIGVSAADSIGYAPGNYITRSQLDRARIDELLLWYKAMGNSIIAFPVAATTIQSSTYTMIDNNTFFVAFILHESQTITGVAFTCGTVGAFTGADFNGVALYSVNENTATRVAISANDENIWKGVQYAKVSVPFTSPYVASAGLYYAAIMYNQSAQTTAPALYCSADLGTPHVSMDRLGRRVSAMSNRTAFNATEVIGNLGFTTKTPYIWLY